jgi:hypothetical protein
MAMVTITEESHTEFGITWFRQSIQVNDITGFNGVNLRVELTPKDKF